MIHAAIILAALFAATLALTLGRIGEALSDGPGAAAMPDPFGAALARIVGWLAFAGAATACLYVLGLVAALAFGGGGLLIQRRAPAMPVLAPYIPYQLPLAVAALLLAILALLGVVDLLEGAFHG